MVSPKQTARKSTGAKAPMQALARMSARKTAPIIAPVRTRPEIVAFFEIRKYQKSTELLLLYLRFVRVVCKLADDIQARSMRWRAEALTTSLQEGAESYLARIFCKTDLCAQHVGRVTVMTKEIFLALRMNGAIDNELYGFYPTVGESQGIRSTLLRLARTLHVGRGRCKRG